MDGLIRGQEASKEKRERKTKIDNPMLADFFVKNPERLKDISMENMAKLSVALSSKNAKEYIEWREALKKDGENNRNDYLEKLVKHLEKRIDFLEKLILEKL